MKRSTIAAVPFIMLMLCCLAPAEDFAPISRRIPPPGIDLPDADRQKIEAGLEALTQRLNALRDRPLPEQLRRFLPDIEIYEKAVRYALLHGEFYEPEDVGVALGAIEMANKRLDALADGRHPWTDQRGLVVRGYRSDIDGSPQPYGLEIPENLDLSKPVPLYVWLHGRGDKTTDLHFIHQRQTRPGQVQPGDAIVLHPFGRHSMGFKSAGEIDVLDAIASVQQRYDIDPDRIVLMGFSMGGAGAWHIGAHYTDRFAALHAGAGFVDVKRYQNLTPEKYPPWYTRELWGMYGVPHYVRNLFNIPVVAYSGEKDKQKDAADYMAETYAAHGRELPHIIGPGMGHAYHPDSLEQVMEFMDEAVEQGRDPYPQMVTLQTQTLRYNDMYWVQVLGLEEHWTDSRVDAKWIGPNELRVTTKNVTRLAIQPRRGTADWSVRIDDQTLRVPASRAETPAGTVFEQREGQWQIARDSTSPPLRKRPGLQGPIDDAFLEPFLVVLPTGEAAHPAVQKWVQFELEHFKDRWRALYRGELRIKKDTQVTRDDIERYNLVLWGDPASNRLIQQVIGELPIGWTAGAVTVGDGGVGEREYDAATHVPLMIYPNPLNPQRYVVINSGPTHREAHDRTNSLQNPHLPDWAVIDLATPPSGEWPGKVVGAGFFDEHWRVQPPREGRPRD